MKAPSDQTFRLHLIALDILNLACDDNTLGYLAKTHSYGTMFECVDSGVNYQYVGLQNGKIACRKFNDDEIILFDHDLKIHRIF
jgi:hypothetical protein